MLRQTARFQERAFTRIELVALLGAIALLASISLPILARPSARADRVECLNNLRRIGQGFQLWANDHTDRFPWNVAPAEGGAMQTQVVDYFRAVSNQLVTPRILHCPADGAQALASTWASLDSRNISYFAGLHADLNYTRAWLSGDRNLRVLSESCNLSQGSISYRVSENSLWTPEIHSNTGNLLLGDGSVGPCSSLDFTNYIQSALSRDLEGALHIAVP